MATNVVLFPRNVSAVPALDERGVTVSELVGDNLKTVPVAQRLDSVGVSPVVESGAREFKYRRGIQMLCQGRELTDREEIRVVRELLGMGGEDLPRPELGRLDDSVPPRSLPSSRVDGSLGQVNIAASQSLDDLPLDARGGHESLDRSVRHRQRVNERLRLNAVKPAGLDMVRCGRVSVVDDVVRDDRFPAKPASELRERGAIPVLRGARTLKRIQEFSDAGRGETGRGENDARLDETTNLSLVLPTLGGPLVDQRRKVGRGERGQQFLEQPVFHGVVHVPEFRFLVDDQEERSPYAVMLESFYHALDVVRNIFVRRAARVEPGPSIGQRDPGLIPIGALRTVRHGAERCLAASYPATCPLETGLTPCA